MWSSCVAFEDATPPLTEALRDVVDWFQSRARTPRLQLLSGSPLTQTLARSGWSREYGVDVLTGGTESLVGSALRDGIERDDWDEILETRRGNGLAFSIAIHDARGRASWGEGTLVFELGASPGWLVLTSIETRADRRGQGLARRIMGLAALKARASGVNDVMLQVKEDALQARQLYLYLRFDRHHSYEYWTYGEHE